MKSSQFRLQRSRAQRCDTVVTQCYKVVLSLHSCYNRRLLHRLDAQRSSTGVFKTLTRLKDGLPSGDSWALNNILVRASNGLDFETTGYELDVLLGLIGDTNIVSETMLVKA